jgi:hypothetical protein
MAAGKRAPEGKTKQSPTTSYNMVYNAMYFGKTGTVILVGPVASRLPKSMSQNPVILKQLQKL